MLKLLGCSGSRSTAAIESMDKQPTEIALTEAERQLLLKSWGQSELHGFENSGQKIFRKIFEINPEIMPVFNLSSTDFTDCPKAFYKHTRVFMNMIELAVSKCDKLEELDTLCYELGKRHAKLDQGRGFKTEYWQAFESAIIMCATEWYEQSNNTTDGVEKEKIMSAWSKLVSYMMVHMKTGFYAAENKKTKKRENKKE